jgi:hypothetical protein
MHIFDQLARGRENCSAQMQAAHDPLGSTSVPAQCQDSADHSERRRPGCSRSQRRDQGRAGLRERLDELRYDPHRLLRRMVEIARVHARLDVMKRDPASSAIPSPRHIIRQLLRLSPRRQTDCTSISSKSRKRCCAQVSAPQSSSTSECNKLELRM